MKEPVGLEQNERRVIGDEVQEVMYIRLLAFVGHCKYIGSYLE